MHCGHTTKDSALLGDAVPQSLVLLLNLRERIFVAK